MLKSAANKKASTWHISLARFRHFTGRGLAVAEFANHAVELVMLEEGRDRPEDIRSNIYINVASKGGRLHPRTLEIWRPHIVRINGLEEVKLRAMQCSCFVLCV